MSINKYIFLSKDKRDLLTDKVLTTFKEELLAIFSNRHAEIKNYTSVTYANFYMNIESTYGFYEALEFTCKKHNLVESIYNYSKSLSWDEADCFDSELMSLMIDRGIIEEGNIL